MGSGIDTSSYTKTYSVHTGTDIFAVFNDSIITTMQGISYSITRQKAPIYTMGSPDPRAIARSKRGIAGSMIMTTFDRHCLSGFMQMSTFAAKNNSIETTSANPNMQTSLGVTPTNADLLATNATQIREPGATSASGASAMGNASTLNLSEAAAPLFADQLLPYDSTLAAANEYGQGSMMRIFAIEILNEGSGISIDDTSNEVQMTYIARLITPWIQQKITFTNLTGSPYVLPK